MVTKIVPLMVGPVMVTKIVPPMSATSSTANGCESSTANDCESSTAKMGAKSIAANRCEK